MVTRIAPATRPAPRFRTGLAALAVVALAVPVGLAAQWLIHKHMPDYQGDARRPLDVIGLVLFGCGIALLSWLLEVFGEHRLDATSAGVLLAVAFALLFAYGWHSRFVELAGDRLWCF